jgi:hypothetical protein
LFTQEGNTEAHVKNWNWQFETDEVKKTNNARTWYENAGLHIFEQK